MAVLLQGSQAFLDGELRPADILLSADNGRFVIEQIADPGTISPNDQRVVDLEGKYVLPGLADVHVHLREPGFSYKETIETGTKAAARGGFTTVGAMPNLSPAPDNLAEMKKQVEAYQRDAVVQVFPYGCLTEGGTGHGEILDYEALSEYAIGFSDDGFGVVEGDVLRQIMQEVAKFGGIVVQHTEDLAISGDGYINDGPYAAKHGHKGKPGEAEWSQIARDLDLVRETGCDYHICHVSTAKSLDLIRQAKAEGLPVTAETAPHYLALCEDDLQEHGRFRMNPPIRERSDMEAVQEALVDGTLDFVATDHAPHSKEEKDVPLAQAQNGVVGLEISVPVVYTHFVKNGRMSFSDFMRVMNTAGRERFDLGGGELAQGIPADLVVFDPDCAVTIDPSQFVSMSKATPFEGADLFGRIDATIAQGTVAWDPEKLFVEEPSDGSGAQR